VLQALNDELTRSAPWKGETYDHRPIEVL